MAFVFARHQVQGASLSACSALLRLASPVFDRMLDCGMQEAQQSVIKVGSSFDTGWVCLTLAHWQVEVARLEDFDVFYSLLRRLVGYIIRLTTE